MAKKWSTLKNADGRSGVRFREHETRKHGKLPDRYYVLTYWFCGKTKTEAVGWASEKWTPTMCFNLLAELKHNQSTGQGPCTLAEMREISDAKRETERRAKEAHARGTFKAFFDDVFLPEARTRWKDQTTEKAIQHVNKWIDPVTGNIPMREIGLPHINRIKNNLAEVKRSPRMQQYVFRTFSMVWNAALDHGMVDRLCPTKSQSFRLQKVDNERQRYLTFEEESTLLNELMKLCCQSHDMALVSLDSGLRFGEIAALTWGCVDLGTGHIQVLNTKSGHDRMVPMTKRLKKMFRSMEGKESGKLVFPNGKGQTWSEAPKAFRKAIKNSNLNDGVTDSKLKASFHTLRHTCASRLVQSGVDLYKVQRILGHSTIVMTQRYAKLRSDDLKEAVRTMETDREIKTSGGKVVKFPKKANTFSYQPVQIK